MKSLMLKAFSSVFLSIYFSINFLRRYPLSRSICRKIFYIKFSFEHNTNRLFFLSNTTFDDTFFFFFVGLLRRSILGSKTYQIKLLLRKGKKKV